MRLCKSEMLSHHLVVVVFDIEIITSLIGDLGVRLGLGGHGANVDHLPNEGQASVWSERASLCLKRQHSANFGLSLGVPHMVWEESCQLLLCLGVEGNSIVPC